ncbi:Lysophospholipase L1 [Clostridium collagenovorans DSM 3089]|uniref:Lysophospholipase L1 n=1 Tax=Clostridium collagenovorans DSM 3089 TaxID=1121306 RepID=A0A1M5X4J7_9CLOT|nr:GDSL-type esterase/lipase family protein [Clostridium collagenovorans]SHH94522.1 Lysophospholipase L1 [Clostridium collagenovorans DSM 3089]
MLRGLKNILRREAKKVDMMNFKTLDKEHIRTLKIKRVKRKIYRMGVSLALVMAIGVTSIVMIIDKNNPEEDNKNLLSQKQEEMKAKDNEQQEDKSKENRSEEDTNAADKDKSQGEVGNDSKQGDAPNNGTVSTSNENKAKEVPQNLKMMDETEFENTSAFIGDSITEGIGYYQYMPKNRVLAEMGFTLKKLKGREGEALKTSPQRVFILFGANDLLMGGSIEKFIEDYSTAIKNIRAISPSTQIYVQSALHVKEETAKDKPLLSRANIDEVNKKLKTMASQQGAYYIDINTIFENSTEDLYAYDGIHVQPKFYIKWLELLRAAVA